MKKILMIILLGILCSSMFVPVVPKVKAESTMPVTASASVNESSSSHAFQPIDNIQLTITESRMTGSELQKLESMIGVDYGNQTYNQIIDGHGTGLAPPSTADWTKISSEAYLVTQVSSSNSSQPPSKVDNSATPWFPPIGNQGSQGSCVAWAVGYYTNTFEEAKEHGWNLSGTTTNEIMSPSFIYNLIDGGVDEGSSYYDAIQLVCSVGECSLANMPYNQADCTSWPSQSAWQEVPFYRGASTGYETLDVSTANGILSLKNWIASGNLAIIAVDARQFVNLTNNDVWTLDNYHNPVVNHANTIVGYDDNFTYMEGGNLTKGAFKVANSWGVGGWEHVPDGFYWISYKAMSQIIGYVMFYQGRIGYVPTLTCSFRINHALRGECSILVGMGAHNNPTASKSFTEYINGGNHPFCPNNIVFDITEFTDVVPNVYGQPFFLSVYDGGTNVTGTILYFSVASTVSASPPIATVNGGNVFADLILGPPLTTVFLTPYRIDGTAGQTVTVYSNITDVTGLLAYQIGLVWSNTTAVECTSVTGGSILNSIPAGHSIEIIGTINNTLGKITAPYAWSGLGSQYNMNGSGTLAVFTFKMLQTGYADVHVNDMILYYKDEVTVIPCNTVDYFTTVRGGKQYVVGIEGNPVESSSLYGGFGAESVAELSPPKSINGTTYLGSMTLDVNGTAEDVGPFAYFNATIPNDLMNCTNKNNWVIELGGVPQSGVLVSPGTQNTTISLTFSYPNSSSGELTQTIEILSNYIAASTFSVTISPGSATLDNGQSRLFTSSVSGGTSPFSYQWYLNGAAVSGATSAAWTFTPSSTGSCTIYVKVTDAASVVATSNTVTATVNPAPTVSVTPTSSTLDVGQSEVFSATASGGTGSLSYQWYLNGVAQGTSSSWTFAPSSSGSYSVYLNVTDNVGVKVKSSVATITVNTALSVSISSTSVILDVGQSQPFTSTVSGGTSPCTYQWYLNNASVSGAKSSSWTFFPSSSGSYSVYVNVTDNTGARAKSNVATATVNNAPSVSISPPSGTMNVSKSQQFNSTVSNGTSPYSYQWYLNGTAVSGANNPTWTFTPTSAGSYTVYLNVTDNEGVSAISLTSNVTVIPIVPEFQLLFFLPLFMMATLLAVLVLERKRKARTQ